MKKKILIGSVLAVLLILSMPVMSNIQAQPALVYKHKETEECSICPNILDEKTCDYPVLCEIVLCLSIYLSTIIFPFGLWKILLFPFTRALDNWYDTNCLN